MNIESKNKKIYLYTILYDSTLEFVQKKKFIFQEVLYNIDYKNFMSFGAMQKKTFGSQKGSKDAGK